MLRRVARVLRGLLFVVGLVLLLWLPASFFFAFNAFACVRGVDGRVSSHSGEVEVAVYDRDVSLYDPSWNASIDSYSYSDRGLWQSALWPRYEAFEIAVSGYGGYTEYVVSLPLWLLAFLCLAWPVTSFVIARRRRTSRGFEVEAKAVSAVSTVDS